MVVLLFGGFVTQRCHPLYEEFVCIYPFQFAFCFVGHDALALMLCPLAFHLFCNELFAQFVGDGLIALHGFKSRLPELVGCFATGRPLRLSKCIPTLSSHAATGWTWLRLWCDDDGISAFVSSPPASDGMCMSCPSYHIQVMRLISC